jgi:hypothetical protein
MSIAQAEHWLRSVVMGQPLHRDNLGMEDSSNGTMRGVSPVTLKLAPQLQQELAQELQMAPKAELTISTPKMGPGGNTMKGPNLHNRTPKPPTSNQTKGD